MIEFLPGKLYVSNVEAVGYTTDRKVRLQDRILIPANSVLLCLAIDHVSDLLFYDMKTKSTTRDPKSKFVFLYQDRVIYHFYPDILRELE